MMIDTLTIDTYSAQRKTDIPCSSNQSGEVVVSSLINETC